MHHGVEHIGSSHLLPDIEKDCAYDEQANEARQSAGTLLRVG